MIKLSKKRKEIVPGTVLFVLATFIFLTFGGVAYGNNSTGGHKPATHYQEQINTNFQDMEDSLTLLENEAKNLTKNAQAFLTTAEYSVKLKAEMSSIMDKIRSQATQGENFEKKYKLLVEEMDEFDNSLPVPGAPVNEPLEQDKAQSLPGTSQNFGVRVSNVKAALQEVTRSMSETEKTQALNEVESSLRGDFDQFEKLLEEQLENAKKSVKAGTAFKENVAAFAQADATFNAAFAALRRGITDLKIANRIAKKTPVISEEYLQKLEAGTQLRKQVEITALMNCTEVENILRHFDRRNKQAIATLKTVELDIKKIRNSHPGLFKEDKLNVLVALLILVGAILYYIYHAQKGTKLFIRKIAGLAALDDAVGRATEMGRPVLFVSGIRDIDDVQTLAGISILASVASTTAEYDTRLFVPCCAPLAYSMAQEVVKESYLKAGRPDAYQRDDIRFLTSDQFGFVAGVNGIMIREEVAATFYLGKFFAESLILAETGNAIGAIQIAGTAESAQLPFFVAACDYTLIGEELFAASAYLSGEPRLLGSLKGQDIGKAIMILAIIFGSVIQILISYGYLPETVSLVQLFQ